ncbi:DinB family protein [Streptomyces acidiscabies]|uniref:DinB family protein n=1 Tax=Streptomyces acidiscabies TaxID=42234 RepID=A0AAP6EC29_9ACTN|nr:DinB family protein [Streptomyces acidiscabies]MBP5941360.1 DinB family protein [Streptomyces sp. LBUM 1476]MBZ3912718.1 DinB family protein [Streptomyces acidiscabies]MDX2958202.1 DinB family protein [Streptomyces acidiscabies]MDX3018569.1 DinB family protein [Streptomyces acidiscabies]MDX3791128.1 DinB family protein [Streptomyces acidiscabies]
MTRNDPKDDLHRYLKAAREAVVWKLDGLSEYDIRRPLTPTGTNLLGLVKHLAGVELGYFGPTFGRAHGEDLPWEEEGAEANADMWARADESRAEVLGLYHRAWAHTDATIGALPLDAKGHVEWWGDNGDVTLQLIMLHVTAETHRHAGHADIVRELIDGKVGMRETNSNMDGGDESWYEEYRNKLEASAKEAQADAG